MSRADLSFGLDGSLNLPCPNNASGRGRRGRAGEEDGESGLCEIGGEVKEPDF